MELDEWELAELKREEQINFNSHDTKPESAIEDASNALDGKERPFIRDKSRDSSSEDKIRTARRCMDFTGKSCDNKGCVNKSCPLNKVYDKITGEEHSK